MTITIPFRGEDADIKFRDYGYESDTNAHVIEWEFVDGREVDLTDAEEQAIYDRCAQASYDSYD